MADACFAVLAPAKMHRVKLGTFDNGIFCGSFERADNLCAFEVRRADLACFTVAYKQNLVHFDGLGAGGQVGQFDIFN